METNIDSLLEQAGWVRGLARRIARDDSMADDLAQETWLAATAHPPADGAPRPWLAQVMRNVRRMAFRRDGRRIARERALVPERTFDDGPDGLVEAVELSRILAEEVLLLDEPYRETVLLRYWRGLSSAQISTRMEVPAGTVRWTPSLGPLWGSAKVLPCDG